jgi:hypothetical protein
MYVWKIILRQQSVEMSSCDPINFLVRTHNSPGI